jgi:hypothetical protein
MNTDKRLLYLFMAADVQLTQKLFQECRERLNGSEIRNLTRVMKTENFFFDLLQVSHSIIDGVSRDIQAQVLENEQEEFVMISAAIVRALPVR